MKLTWKQRHVAEALANGDRKGQPRRPFTLDEDAYIIASYSKLRFGTMARKLKRNYGSIQQRTYRLIEQGRLSPLSRSYHREWTAQEDAEIRGRIGWDTLAAIAKDLKRSENAVKIHANRALGLKRIDARRSRARYSARDVGRIFSVDSASVRIWIDHGWLHAVKSEAGAGKHRRWLIGYDDLERFIREHPAYYERRRIEQGTYWRELADQVATEAEQLFIVSQAAIRLKLAEETIRRYIRAGKIHATSLYWSGGSIYRISESELERCSRELPRNRNAGTHYRRREDAA